MFPSYLPTVAALTHLLLRDGVRLLTLLGPPGSGKSTLARGLAAALERDGTPVSVFDFAADGGPRRLPRGRITSKLNVVVLDHADVALREVQALVTRGLAQDPSLVVVCTARAPIDLAGETRHEVRGLEVEDAVALFCMTAARVGVHVDGGADIRSIVEALEGNPLAIELAASRLAVLSVDQIGAALERDPLGLLRASARVGTHCHSSLKDALDASWQRMSPFEREALRQCAMFDGPFTVDEAVTRLMLPAEAPAVLDLVAALRDRSMLRVVSAPHEKATLLAVSRLVRAFCEQLEPTSAPRSTPRLVSVRSEAELRVERNGDWFEVRGRRVSLGRRAAMKRVFHALVHHRECRPGAAIAADELIAVGWPGENLRGHSGVARLRVAINELRNMGLRPVLVTRSEGYLLAPTVPLETIDDAAA